MHTRSHGGTPKTVRRQKWKKGPWSLLRFHWREWAGRIGTLSKLWDSLNSFGGLWDIGMVLIYRVPGPGRFWEGGILILSVKV